MDEAGLYMVIRCGQPEYVLKENMQAFELEYVAARLQYENSVMVTNIKILGDFLNEKLAGRHDQD